MADLTRDEVRALAREVGVTDPVSYDAMTRLVNAALARHDASAWWALVMGAAACIEDAANCLRDLDAKKQAQGAAKHYREAAKKLLAAAGVMREDGGRDSNPRQPACAGALPTEAPYSSDRDTCFGTELPTVPSIVGEAHVSGVAAGAVTRPHCRDCADFAQDGICPNSGKPCASGVKTVDGGQA